MFTDSLARLNRETAEFRILHPRNAAIISTAVLDFRRSNFDHFKGLISHELQHWNARGSHRAARHQAPLPPSSQFANPDGEEIKRRWQETYKDEQGAHGKSQREKGKPVKCEKGSVHLVEI